MNKLLSALTAGMMVLAMNGFAVAQDAASQPNTEQSAKPETQQDTQAQPAGQAGDSAKQDTQAQPAAQSGDVAKQDSSAKEEEYSAALKKCEALSGSEKAKCTEAAKKKNGEM